MNTHNTQYHPREYLMPRSKYHELQGRDCQPRPSRRQDRAYLGVFAAGVIALLAYGLMWSLR